ncbi:MAG TPA: BBP7 family outer membrane beta-barrel protein [Pirellulales bacterium]
MQPPIGSGLPDMVYMVTAKSWFRADALLWWTKSMPVSQPIVTTGSLADSAPGAIGQPGTKVLFGANNYSYNYVGGIRLETGVWFDPGRVVGVEAGYFVLIEQERDYSNQSNIVGNPLIARPTINATTGVQTAYYDSLPGTVAGGVTVKLRSEFQGANCDGAFNLIQTRSVRVDGIGGFRYLNLAESMNVSDQFVDPLGGTRAFAGAPINFNDSLSVFDGIHTTNSFYGGGGGARFYYAEGRWYITALGKVALGPMQEVATVLGTSSQTDQTGHTTTVPGGVLANSATMGRYYQSVFAVAPEGRLNFGYQITPLITMRVGYTFIYVSNVARPGDQVTRVVNPGQVPTDRAYSPTASNLTAFQFHTSSYWAQGLNFGLDFRF